MASVERDFEATAKRMLDVVPISHAVLVAELRGDIKRCIRYSAFRAPESRHFDWDELGRSVANYFEGRSRQRPSEPECDWEKTLVDILTGRLPEGAVVIDIREAVDADLGNDD